MPSGGAVPCSAATACPVMSSSVARSVATRAGQAPRGAKAALTRATEAMPTTIAATRLMALSKAICGMSMSEIATMPTVYPHSTAPYERKSLSREATAVQAPSHSAKAASSMVRSWPKPATTKSETTPPSTVPASRQRALDRVMPASGWATMATQTPALDAVSSWTQNENR